MRLSFPAGDSLSEKTGRVRRGRREGWEVREYRRPRAAW